MANGRFASLKRTLGVAGELLQGRQHDRHSVAALGGVQPAAADRQLRALERFLPGVAHRKHGHRRVYSFDLDSLRPPPDFSTVIAACFGASLAPLFSGSGYEVPLLNALNYVLERARRRSEFKHLDRKFRFLHRGGDASLADRSGELQDLIDAVLHHQFATIVYQRFEGPQEMIRVRPLSIAIYDHQLYVLARSEQGDDYPYRLARITAVQLEDTKFEYPDRSSYDPDQMFRDSFGVFASDTYPVELVRIRIAERWRNYIATHRWHPSQKVVEEGDGFVLSIRVRVCPEVRAWILGFGDEAEVLEPTTLRDDIRSRLRGALARYEASAATESLTE